jgi:hypothetical protein
VDLAFLNTVGIIGVLLSAIPFGMGFWFMVLPVLSRFGFIGFLYFPAYLIYGLIKHHEDVEYGFSLFWKSSLVMFPSIALIQYF